MEKMTRRQLLATTAAGAAGLAASAGTVSALALTGHDTGSCGHNHHALGHKLSTLIADPAVDDVVKNLAIKTSHCPTCGTGIAPTGLGLAASTWS